MICPKCGTELRDGVLMCPICGTKQEYHRQSRPKIYKITRKSLLRLGLLVSSSLQPLSLSAYARCSYSNDC